METVSFYSYKGGVGRSLALTNLGVYLTQFGATVVLIDLDLEAPGLHYKLKPSEPVDVPNRGVAGLLADASHETAPLADLADLAVDVTDMALDPAGVSDGAGGRLLLVPAGNPRDPQYWNDVAAIDWKKLFTGAQAGVAALSQLKRDLVARHDPDILLVDSRTGITPGGGVATTLLPDVVVTLLLNSAEHLDGTRAVVRTVTDPRQRRAPRVVPVLSRYAAPRRRLLTQMGASDEEAQHEDLAQIGDALSSGLEPAAAERIGRTQVLHSDASLLHRETLAFGRFAPDGADRTEGSLLEDYLRLFAAVVPRETVTKYSRGVRERVRAVLLDRPDDAVNTLEGLLSLVNDEEAYEDLLKIYALRRDTPSMLATAARMYRVHGSVTVAEPLTQALKAPRGTARGRGAQLAPDFQEAYWRAADPDDIGWAARVALAHVTNDAIGEAARLADELIDKRPDARTLSVIVGRLALGPPEAERLAVSLALEHSALGAGSPEYLRSAASAARYQRDRALAEIVLEDSASAALEKATVIQLLDIAGRSQQAVGLLIDTLALISADDDDAREYVDVWTALGAHHHEIREELSDRNPEIVYYLDQLATSR